MSGEKSFTIAVAQVTPIVLDLQATLEKACDVIAEAGRNGAKLVVFPEAFIPAYPDWVWLIPGGRVDMLDELYVQLVKNALWIKRKEIA